MTAQAPAAPTKHLPCDGHGYTRQLINSSLTPAPAGSYDACKVMLSDNSRPEAAAQTSLLYAGQQYDSTLNQY